MSHSIYLHQRTRNYVDWILRVDELFLSSTMNVKLTKKHYDHKFAAKITEMVKTSEEAVADKGAEEVRGSIELQLFSVQLKHTL